MIIANELPKVVHFCFFRRLYERFFLSFSVLLCNEILKKETFHENMLDCIKHITGTPLYFVLNYPHIYVCTHTHTHTMIFYLVKLLLSKCADKYEKDAKKYWETFYKRNTDKVIYFSVLM